MSPRKTILAELSRTQQDGRSAFRRPSEISGFADRPEKYQKAINELLQARLVEGQTDDEGRMTIALNEHRLQDVKKELRPAWAHPVVLLLIVVVAAVGAFVAI